MELYIYSHTKPKTTKHTRKSQKRLIILPNKRIQLLLAGKLTLFSYMKIIMDYFEGKKAVVTGAAQGKLLRYLFLSRVHTDKNARK